MERKPLKNRFNGKAAIVTGASAGIGFCILEELAKEGAKVSFTGVSELGYETEKKLKAAGLDVMFIRGDMESEAFCKQVVDQTAEAYGAVHYLVNNAFSFVAKWEDASHKDWERSLFVGPVGYARMISNCRPYMEKAGGGSIVNMSSISGTIAQINRWTYNMAKGAVNQLTKCAALDYAKFGIRVNTVSPAWVWTRETAKGAEVGGGREKCEPVWGDFHMLGRIAEPVEIAGPTLFLLSDDASFVTGTDLHVDGGYLALGPEGIGKSTFNAGSY